MDSTESELSLNTDFLREQGNRAFREGRYKKAVQIYSDCLTVNPSDHQIWSNRSASYLRLGYIEEAFEDAKQCVSLSGSNWMKGLYRLGQVYEQLEQWTAATDAFSKALNLDKSDKEIEKKIKNCKKQAGEEELRRKAQLGLYRRDAVFRLKQARQADARNALISQYKESMTSPDWDIEEYEWRPTFFPWMKVKSIDVPKPGDDRYSDILLSFLKSLSDLSTPRECIEILRDKERLQFYEREIKHALSIRTGCHVVIAGHWSCLYGIIAAMNGAGKVTCIEQCQTMYKVTTEVLKQNKALLDGSCSINVLPVDIFHCTGSKPDSEVEDGLVYVDPADIFVSDLFNLGVVDDGILQVLDQAQREFLHDDSVIIPSAVEVSAVLVDTSLNSICGFDFTSLEKYQWSLHLQKVQSQSKCAMYKQLSEVFDVFQIDLQAAKEKHDRVDKIIQTNLTTSGTLTGILTGFKVKGDSAPLQTLSSWKTGTAEASLSPKANSSFHLGLQYLDASEVHAGQTVDLRIVHDNTLFQIFLPEERSIPRHALLPEWHFDMLRDSARNEAYEKAIKNAIEIKKASGISQVHVFDGGAGSGLLSLLAARNGAAQVTAVEFPGHTADLCEENVIMNGYYSTIQVVPKSMKTVAAADLKAKADILVMEVFDCGLIGEGVLHLIDTAAKNLLKEDAILVPCGATLYAQPVQLNRADKHFGFDLSSINAFRWRPEYEEIDCKDGSNDILPLAEPAEIITFDFYDIGSCLESLSKEFYLRAKESGVLNAVLFWFELCLDDEQRLSTSPYNGNIKTTWGQAVQWMEEKRVESGSEIHLQATHDAHGFNFEILNKDLEDTGVPLVDPLWKQKFQKTQNVNNALMKTILENPQEFRKLTNKALRYASRPSDVGLNTREAVAFCKRLFQ